MPATVHFDQHERLEIVDRYLSGEGMDPIAKAFGVSVSPIQRVLRETGVATRPGGPRVLTPAQQREAHAKYEAGEAVEAIAALFGCSVEPIKRVVREGRRSGTLRRPPHGSESVKARRKGRQITELYEQGLARRAIADQLELPFQAVSNVLREAGIPLRDDRGRRGPMNPAFRGKPRRQSEGYIKVWVDPESPFAVMADRGSYVLEHRLTMAKNLGRPLFAHERVHHRNGNRSDNRIENLELWEFGHPYGQRTSEATVQHCPSCTCPSQPTSSRP